MRIAICAAQVPFVRGGAEIHVEGLRNALIGVGHEVEIISLPFKWYPQTELLKSALSWRMIDVTEADGKRIDLAICTKFPTWAVKHPNKIAWIIHQYRQAYDWFGTDYSDLTNSPDDMAFRRRIQHIDSRGLGECRARFANSQNTANRLKRFNGLDAEPLHVPVQLHGLSPEAYDPFVLTVSRLDRSKRIGLLIEAVADADSPLHVVVAGAGPERENLEKLAHRLDISGQVQFLGRVSDEVLVDYYNRCRAVFYGPVDEDFGLATVEAFTAGKPVITVADSGGVLELVSHGETGLIADCPEPQEIAGLVAELLADEGRAREMGMSGRAIAEAITWDRVVERLLGAVDG